MNRIDQQAHPITLVISEVVEPNHVQAYEAWTKGINQAASQFEGYLGVDIIRPRDHTFSEYVVIVKFDQYTHFRNWATSSTYQTWMEQSRGLVASRTRQQQPSGLEMWFMLPNHPNQKQRQPAYYKMVTLGVLSVYPLILLANALLGPLLKGLPGLLALLISVTFVSALLTYPVMPCLTWMLSFWLYPSVSKRQRKMSKNHKKPL